MIIALLDTETSGKNPWQHSILQLSCRLIDTCDVPKTVAMFAPEPFDLHEHLLSFERVRPPTGRELAYQAEALRVNRIGMNARDRALPYMERQAVDVGYCWAWILEHHDQSPAQVMGTLLRGVHDYQLRRNYTGPVFMMCANPAFDKAFVDRYFESTKVMCPFFYAPLDIKQAFSQFYKEPFEKCTMSGMMRKLKFNKDEEAHTADADTSMMMDILYKMFHDGYRII